MKNLSRPITTLSVLQLLLATAAQAGFTEFSASNPLPAPIHRVQAAIDLIVTGAHSGTTASTIGSVAGNVTIIAGNQYRQVGTHISGSQV